MLPGHLKGMLDMLPDRLPPAQPLPDFIPAEGPRRARVAFLAGCVQQVLAPAINWATLRVLAKNGVEVVIPDGQGCCGAILLHSGELDQARQLARQNIRLFPRDVDAVITNAAGCGSGMHEYPMLFSGQADESQATEFSARVQDVSQFLAALGMLPPTGLPQPLQAAYHDACHLAHAQGVTEAPRRLLGSIPNLELREIPDGSLCCGSAGTYNLEQPEIARRLGSQKVNNIRSAGGSQAVIAGNIGCLVQIRKHLEESGPGLPVYHTFEILDLAYHS
jgi:glycolate oxidase iron-sulfur subunit